MATHMISFHTDLAAADWEALRADLIADNFHNGRTTRQLRLSCENSNVVAMAFLCNGLLDLRALTRALCCLVPDSVLKGKPTLLHEGCRK